MKCTPTFRGSHLRKWLGFARKSLESYGVNSDELSSQQRGYGFEDH